MEEDFVNILQFLKNAERLKTELRHSWTGDSSRQESVAEHTWMMSLLAILFIDQVDMKLDKLKAFKMIIVHDLVEVFCGDVPSFEHTTDRAKNKSLNERKALEKLLADLPEGQKEEIYNLWEEFEAKVTPESQFVQCLDKIEALIQHSNAGIQTWDDGDYRLNIYYKDDYFDIDPVLRELKNVVNEKAMSKIIESGNSAKVPLEDLKRYKFSENLHI